MEINKTTDHKLNVAELTKIPPNEFEKYFKDWMERDDVARSLQAKLRCDLITNFNKTNLGKHISSQTMTTSGGTMMRLTLSPLILALNTLVAEFLYAQNCHFTLSVFCTEIPFRNTLPDFEIMSKFRFNKEEISELWQAVTGSKADKGDLNKHIIQNYESNSNISLLLLIMKYLLKNGPPDQLKRNAEVQTELREMWQTSIPFQVSHEERKPVTKTNVKYDNNLYHINKYLLTLSEKVGEMTREFEQCTKQKCKSRTCSLKSSRSREYYSLNKSLERITENMKVMARSKRKNKSFKNIMESIENLTQQFGEFAQNFNNLTKFLESKEHTPVASKVKCVGRELEEQQTEAEIGEKSYNDWIYEIRNTKNGQMFLNRVEISLKKALFKHQVQLKNETNIKMQHLKSLMKLHYKQKLSKILLQDPIEKLKEARKCNDNERKLDVFERKQMELLQKLQESSIELKKSQLQPKLTTIQHEYVESVYPDDVLKAKCECGPTTKETMIKSPSKDILNVQYQILDVARDVAEKERSVDEIVHDAKLRIQQLENESNQLEQNFQAYLLQRKHFQKKNSSNKEDFYEIATDCLWMERRKTKIFDNDEQVKEELQCLKEKFRRIKEPISNIRKTGESSSSTSSREVKNFIPEAKLKFFEHENTLRKCRDQGNETHTGHQLQKQLGKYSELQEVHDYAPETIGNFNPSTDVSEKLELNTESSSSEINIKHKTLDEDQDINLSSMTGYKSQKLEEKTPAFVRRELFPKHLNGQNDNLRVHLAPHDSIGSTSKCTKQRAIEEKQNKKTETISVLIKQSMAKMQLLFEQQPKSHETLKEIVNELQQEKALLKEDPKTTTRLIDHPNETFNKSFTTTVTSTDTSASNEAKTSEDIDMKTHPKISEEVTNIDRNSHTSGRSLLTLYNGSENDSANIQETEMIKSLNALEITIDSSVSSERQLKAETNAKFVMPNLNLNSSLKEKELGETVTETELNLNISDGKSLENSSRSSSDSEISADYHNMQAKNLSNDSGSDFWA